MNRYLKSHPISFVVIVFLFGLLCLSGCKQKASAVLEANVNGPKSNSINEDPESSQGQEASLLSRLSAIDYSDAMVFDPYKADDSLADSDLGTLKARADGGDPDVLAEVGLRYETGTGTSINYKLAAEYYVRAAEKQHAIATVRLGLMYCQGRGTRYDPFVSATWFRIAAEQSHPFAMARLGKQYLDGTGVGRDLQTALSWLRKAAEQGEPEALLEIARILRNGWLGEQDFDEANRLEAVAEQLMESAAANNNLRAMHWIADRALSNPSTQGGFDEAQRWLLRASQLGDTTAMIRLAELLLETGKDDAQRLAEAVAWCTKAMDQDDPVALLMMADLCEQGNGVPQSHRRAFELRRQIAQRGEIRAMRLTAEMLIKGRGTELGVAEAVGWYQSAAALGDIASLVQLGICFKDGRGLDRNDAAARALFTRGAANSDPESLFQLGWYCESGTAGKVDLAGAAQYFERSADMGHREAMFRLANLLERDEADVQSPLEEAIRWYRMAALHGHADAARKLVELYSNGQEFEASQQELAFWRARAEAEQVLMTADESGVTKDTPFGVLVDPSAKCMFVANDGILSLTVPGVTANITSQSAVEPRVVQDFSGDVHLEVIVSGNFQATTEVSNDSGIGTQAGCLLIREDDENFVRVDRASIADTGGVRHCCIMRSFQKGMLVFEDSHDIENQPVRLRLERRGDRIRAAFSMDGGEVWTLFRSQESALGEVVQAGAAVVNTTTNPLTVEFKGLPANGKATLDN